jgi:hypothetical protein
MAIAAPLIKQKSRSTLRKTAKATGFHHLFNLKSRSLSELSEVLDRYVDRKLIPRRKKTVKINGVPT